MLLRGETFVAEILPDFGMSIVSLRDGSGREQLRRRPERWSTKAPLGRFHNRS